MTFTCRFYDLIRGAFLKWSFQLKIGRMDGAFVAYHNVEKIQGFEYITKKEIDKRIFGTEKYAETIFAVRRDCGGRKRSGEIDRLNHSL